MISFTETTPAGLELSYWEVIQTNFNWLRKESHLVIGGWVNQKTKTEQPQKPITSKSFDLNGIEFSFSADKNILKQVESKISSLLKNTQEQSQNPTSQTTTVQASLETETDLNPEPENQNLQNLEVKLNGETLPEINPLGVDEASKPVSENM